LLDGFLAGMALLLWALSQKKLKFSFQNRLLR